jgi:hypothetical protein
MGPFYVGEIPSAAEVFTIYDGSGDPRDLTAYDESIVAYLTDPNGATVPVGTVQPIDPGQPARVVLTFGSVSYFPIPGVYNIQFKFTATSGAVDFSKIASFDVEPVAGSSVASSWASISEVADITGQTITQEQLLSAQSVIEITTNRTMAASGFIRTRDLLWLKRGVAYQAVWMASQPDLFSRTALSEVSQDGFVAKFDSKASVYLGPLAQRALKNLSWVRSRSVRMQSAFIDGDRAETAQNALGDDSLEMWQDLGSWS